MGQGAHVPIEDMEVFRRYVEVADWIWVVVNQWSPLARNTVGTQLVRAIDRVGATLVEGDGRSSDKEAAHFFTIARASARETRYWLQRAVARNLISTEELAPRMTTLISATQLLNRLIAYRRGAVGSRISEPHETYETTDLDPFTGNTISTCDDPNT